ncbi:hypothetical protein B0H63DRAFT_525954 [Podospora didyma]|uniref:Heterokaryon incompatibility domain-containing protein n=1 Tax=Podospora didyma TaxID=330526 RepID=A0AAE0KES2_9PEZI|nr:hypothetical protein B0H63DRAFT_525954 [Podospora didyma]
MGNEESKVSEKGLQYKTLKTRKNQIRLIKFEPRCQRPEEARRLNLSLHTVSLDEKPAYHCLSYVWGEPEFIWPVSVDGSLVHITPTLGQALNQLEHENLQALWADGICIDQRDVAECEARLLTAMGLLNTTGVRVFRSLTVAYINYLFQAIRKAGSDVVDPETQTELMHFRDAIKLADDHDTRDAFAIDASHRMLTRDAIAEIQEGRIWIVQELVEPDVVILRCGSTSARLDHLHSVRNFVFLAGHTKQDLIPRVDDFPARSKRLHTCLTNPANSLHFFASVRQNRYTDIKSVESWDTIHAMLRQCWQLKSTINLDKVYGLMNVSGDASELRDLVSYEKTKGQYKKSMGQLGMEVMRMTLTRHGLKHLQEGLCFYYPMDPEAPPDETEYTVLSPEIACKQFRASSGYSHKVSASDFGPSNPRLPVNDILRVPCRMIGEIKRICDLSTRTWAEDAEDYEMAQLAMGHAIINEVESFFDQDTTWSPCYTASRCDTGYVGLGPRQTLEGDRVVIFPDVDVPYVLRPCEGGFKILGQAYVLGIMNGEILGDGPTGKSRQIDGEHGRLPVCWVCSIGLTCQQQLPK